MKALDYFRKVYPTYNEFNAEEAMESDLYVAFEEGFSQGRRHYEGQVIQLRSDLWYQFDGRVWNEMTVEEQVEWSR